MPELIGILHQENPSPAPAQATPSPPKPRAKPKPMPTGPRSRSAVATRTPKVRKRLFLKSYAQFGNVRAASEAAGVERSTYYYWCEHDNDFALAFKQAKEDFADSLETALTHRGRDGVVRKKYTSRGQPVIDPATGEHVVERTYSDALLMFQLKKVRPDEYRDSLAIRHQNAEGQDLVSIAALGAAVAEYDRRKSDN